MTDGKTTAESSARREVKARNTSWARALAASLAKAGVQPNWISWLSVICAAGAGAALVRTGNASGMTASLLMLSTVLLILLRLLCNLFDGMVAVEGGLGTKSGGIFNDLPDRISDPLILVCAGYAIPDVPFALELGWLAGLLSVLTAYTRTLAGATGAKQLFLGPMAKQHRMAVISFSLIAASVTVHWNGRNYAVTAALILISIGCIITVIRRTRAAVKELEGE